MRDGRLLRQHVVPCLLFAACALFLFRLSLFEGWTFIGDSDRINSVINTRLFEVGALRERGDIPAWSDQQFMGYSIVGLHWMLTEFSPVPYLLVLLPTSAMLYALSVLSAVLLTCTIAAAYWMLGAYSTSLVPRIVGALLYGLGSYTVHKLTQLDLSFAALTAAPVLVLLVRVTHQDTAVKVFVALTALWAGLVGYTVLQEIAYIAMFFGTYALYRSVRTRSLWPALVAGLAFGCGVSIASPRVLTVATDIPDVARTTISVATSPEETLRYFGDGLLGRIKRENNLVRGVTVNLHEGVQLLSSSMGAWAVVMAGLVSRSRVIRLWAVGLVLVLSIVALPWLQSYYDAVLRVRSLSRALLIVAMNGVLIGLPLWFFTRWPASRGSPARVHQDAQPVLDETPAAAEDAPFFLAFCALAMAAIVIPEARLVLYYGFMKMDFLHSRISVAMTLPLAAMVTILLSRFLPSGISRATMRWLGVGAILGLLAWTVREAAAEAVVAQTGEVLEALRPRRLLTIETVRVVSSLLVLLCGVALLIWRARPAVLTWAGGLLAAWIVLETVTAADFKLNGLHTRAQGGPFDMGNYLNVPPGGFTVPSAEEQAAVRQRLEADQYRVVMQQSPVYFTTLIEPHLAALWNLRMVEGYSTGLPRRLEQLPWQEGVTTPHHLDITDRHGIPWRLLAALNVKYVVAVDQSLWYNPAPGGAVPPLDVQQLRIEENPHPVAPRAFFAARVSPAGDTPLLPGDTGARPAPADPPIEDLTAHSVVEGLDIDQAFTTAGAIDASFDGDAVRVRVDSAPEDRFLVLNERPYPGWRATVDGRPTEIYPTNIVMRGLIVPAGATLVELRYVPFIVSGYGLALLVAGLVLTVLAWWGLRCAVRRLPTNGRQPARAA